MRAFIAIPIPKVTANRLSEAVKILKESGCNFRWVRPENMHITLKFLGNCEDKKINMLKNMLEKYLSGHGGFETQIAGLGAFPSMSSAKIIWAGIGKGAAECIQLQKKIESIASSAGVKSEKCIFSPHITIGRIPLAEDTQMLSETIIKKADFTIRSRIRITSIALFSSELKKSGPIYSKLEEFLIA